jgi:hypothetical protein
MLEMLDITQLIGFGGFSETAGGATWSAIDKTANITLSNNNKDADSNSTAAQGVRSATVMANNSGKWYCEVNLTSDAGPLDGTQIFGIDDAANFFSTPGNVTATPADMYVFRSDGRIINNGAFTPGFTNWDETVAQVAMLAFDTASGAGKIWFGLNGTWEAGGNPGAGTGAQFSAISNINVWTVIAGVQGTGVGSGHIHADIRSAAGETAYAPPAGFSRLA